MEVLFPNKKLMRLFSDQAQLQKRWSAAGEKRISLRLQQLASATCLADMRDLPGRCHELSGDRAGYLAVDVLQPYRLILKPSADPPPAKDDGGLDWDAVDSVTITEIVDYH